MEVKSCSKEVLTELTEVRKCPGMTMSVFVPIAFPPVLFSIKKNLGNASEPIVSVLQAACAPKQRCCKSRADVQSKGGTQRPKIEILVVRNQINCIN